METVTTIDEARDWFLGHASSTEAVMCEANGKQQECLTYPEAVRFFEAAELTIEDTVPGGETHP